MSVTVTYAYTCDGCGEAIEEGRVFFAEFPNGPAEDRAFAIWREGKIVRERPALLVAACP